MRKLWVNGESLDGGGEPVEVIEPSTEEVIGLVARGDPTDVDRVEEAAGAAYLTWRRTPAPERAELLHEIARRLRNDLEAIAVELTLETGRTLRKNRGYVEWSAQCFDYYAELGRHHKGRVIPSPEASQLSLVIKAPLGVVACIVPWNYPLLLLAWKLAPALAAGNTVVIKPASYTPWTTLGLAQVFDHMPPGTVNILPGSGGEVGEALIRHPEVRMIAFTGSTEVGQHLMRVAADDVKRLNLELGGKDPLIDNLAGPFGGFKRSGLGRELGIEGFEAFTETKHVHWEIEGGVKPWWYPWEG